MADLDSLRAVNVGGYQAGADQLGRAPPGWKRPGVLAGPASSVSVVAPVTSATATLRRVSAVPSPRLTMRSSSLRAASLPSASSPS